MDDFNDGYPLMGDLGYSSGVVSDPSEFFPPVPSPYDPLPVSDSEPVEDIIYTITLADGTTLDNLRLSGNNFVSDTPVTKEQFEYNLSPVTISYNGINEKHENMMLNHIQEIDGQWYFILLDIPQQQLWQEKVDADIIYLSMMTGAELE